ncbi:DUF6339 family protein [Chryseobacterium camelliae]|uniref:DUF6339 family protein n=1 Tax=Chryseobacterium camelliae TaxID=1265445 RepID=UPI002864A857|nr:DUF6339 family protein [Chryseobacterium camelliae]MDR6517324.1 hypothetical protein [Chryseobacterium camelliae]
MSQLIFREGLIDEFLLHLEKDNTLLDLYLDQEKFRYQFNEKSDFIISDIPDVPDNIGDELIKIFNNNSDPSKSNDFRTADFECAKYFYETLQLTPKQASNKDFWNYLHHFSCYQYIHKRWNRIYESEEESRKTYIKRHWLMNLSSQKHLINFPLTTLWWSIHVSIDDANINKYELSQIYFQNNRYRTVTFGGSSYVRHKPAILGILEYIKENNLQPTAELGDDLSKFVNLLGGTKPLSFFGKGWFKDRIHEFLSRSSKEVKKVEDKISTESKAAIYIDYESLDLGKIIKIINLNNNGTYSITNKVDTSYDYNLEVKEYFKNGYLLVCYFNDGNINKVTISSLLNKTRERYQNGLYPASKLKKLVLIPEEAIICIVYKIKGERFFKAHLSSKFKENNETLGLQGYKTMYSDFDQGQIDYYWLPIELEDELSKLIFSSLTASGKSFNNRYYKKEFEIINSHLFKSTLL